MNRDQQPATSNQRPPTKGPPWPIKAGHRIRGFEALLFLFLKTYVKGHRSFNKFAYASEAVPLRRSDFEQVALWDGLCMAAERRPERLDGFHARYFVKNARCQSSRVSRVSNERLQAQAQVLRACADSR